jgi:hypothetical protein
LDTSVTFEFRPARRVAETVLLGLVGPSGSGKTYSALLVATGLCAPGARIIVIDTEGHHGRALQYAPPGGNTFDFDHLKLIAPYSAERYQEAFKAAEARAGAGGVVIIDSMSAEHESEGGALEEHHRRTGGDAKMNMIAWAHIRPNQHALCRALTNSPCHVIVCFRAEDKVKVVGNKPVPVGWQAIGWKRWPYEMQVCVLLSHERKGVPIVDGFEWGKIPINLAGVIPTDRPLTAEVGKRLAGWASGGQKQQDPEPGRGRATAAGGERGAGYREDGRTGAANWPVGPRPTPEAPAAGGSPAPDDVAAARKLWTDIKRAPDMTTLAELDDGSRELIARLDRETRDKIGALFAERLAEFQTSSIDEPNMFAEELARIEREENAES